jgi:hypothetical protein
VKYSPEGVHLWTRIYNGPLDYDEAYSIAADNSGNVFVTGNSHNNGPFYDFATIKYNSNGIQQWIERYGEPGEFHNEVTSLCTFGNGIIYVCGASSANETGYDYVTIKYSQQIGINPISSDVPDKFFLSQNYPNPFNPVTKIKFDIPASPVPSEGGVQEVRLIIYDILGRQVASLIPPLWGGQEGLKPGTYEVEFDGTNYPNGVYFYKLIAGSYTDTKKLVLLK